MFCVIIEDMKRSIFIFSLITFLSFSPLFAQQVADSSQAGSDSQDAFAIIPNLEPEEVKDIESSRTKVIFKTNVKNCRISLNHEFQGYSKLSLLNLVEGFYLLRADKEGYDYQEKFVYVERGKEKTFYIELEPNEETKKKLEARANAQSEAKASSQAEEPKAEAEPEVSTAADHSIGDIQ